MSLTGLVRLMSARGWKSAARDDGSPRWTRRLRPGLQPTTEPPRRARVELMSGSWAGRRLVGGVVMQRAAIAATLFSLALTGGAAAQGVVATNPVTGAATGAA